MLDGGESDDFKVKTSFNADLPTRTEGEREWTRNKEKQEGTEWVCICACWPGGGAGFTLALHHFPLIWVHYLVAIGQVGSID